MAHKQDPWMRACAIESPRPPDWWMSKTPKVEKSFTCDMHTFVTTSKAPVTTSGY